MQEVLPPQPPRFSPTPRTPTHACALVGAGGTLMTVFSAPDYPQFQLPGERYNNLGAVLRLSGPDYSMPHALQFAASLPRPEVSPTPLPSLHRHHHACDIQLSRTGILLSRHCCTGRRAEEA